MRCQNAAHLRRTLLVALMLLGGLTLRAFAVDDNLTRLAECARTIADSLIGAYSPGDTLCIYVAEHDGSWLVEEAFIAEAESRGIVLSRCADPARARVSLAVTSLGIDYIAVEEPDSLQRVARLDLSTSYPMGARPSGGVHRVATRAFSCRQSDTVASDETSSLEIAGYDFVKGTPPQRSSSGFLDKVVEPAVVIGSAVIMVILLFTVRSQ